MHASKRGSSITPHLSSFQSLSTSAFTRVTHESIVSYFLSLPISPHAWKCSQRTAAILLRAHSREPSVGPPPKDVGGLPSVFGPSGAVTALPGCSRSPLLFQWSA